MNTWWLLLITLHAISAVVCLASGLLAVDPARAKKHTWLMPVCIISLVGVIVFVSGAILASWHKTTPVQHAIFCGLVGLALYMLYRGLRARNKLREHNVPKTYIDDIGFIIISLLDAFTIVALIDVGAPIWLIVAGAIFGVGVGITIIHSAKHHYTQAT